MNYGFVPYTLQYVRCRRSRCWRRWREHALALGLIESHSVGSVHVAPGNAGTAMVATNHPVSASDIDGIIGLAKTIDAGLVVVGPEGPLVAGLSDRLREEGIPSFGPHEEGARLEGSKEYAKQVMLDLGVPCCYNTN